MPGKVKCPVCGKEILKEEAVPLNNRRYACPEHAEEYKKSQIEKAEKAEAEKKAREEEAKPYRDLIAYVCNLFQIQAPTMLMVTQIKKFKEEYGYTYQGMQATLQYFFETLGHNTEDSMGVGIIPYMYEETRNFYADRKKLAAEIASCDINDINKSKHITINISDREISSQKERKLIDISRIGGDEDE